MKIPDKVTIGPYVYTVDCTKELDCRGEIEYMKQEIRIDVRNLTPFKTLLHEAMHAIEEYSRFELTEKQVTHLSNGLYCFLRDNGFLKE